MMYNQAIHTRQKVVEIEHRKPPKVGIWQNLTQKTPRSDGHQLMHLEVSYVKSDGDRNAE